MAYDYRCTYCGKLLNQHNVNIQLLLLLGETAEKELKHFTFQVTAGEFRDILSKGKPAGDGFTHCEITFPQYMEYLSGPCNRNDPQIRNITLEQFELFSKEDYEFEQLYEEDSSDKVEQEKVQREEVEALFLNVFGSADKAKQADRRKSTKLLWDLRKEAIIVRNTFDKTGALTFDISLLDNLEDDKGDRIFYGYMLRNPKTRQIRIYNQARTCSNPLCRNPVFEFAGSAEHKSVAFIGDQTSGKTSTMIALASYAERACQGGGMRGDPIWDGIPGIPGIGECRVLGRNRRYHDDMERYDYGIAPWQTEFCRGFAYSVTLQVSPRNSTRYKLLTLIDMPGEIMGFCLDSYTNNIYNNFPQALSCDAYILCYDARPKAINTRQNLTVALEKFQKEHLYFRRQEGNPISAIRQYIPVLVAFNKCPELEDPTYVPQNVGNVNEIDRIAATYIFDDERRIIAQNPKYNDLCEGLKNGYETKCFYQAAIRVAPFGFPAWNIDYVPGEAVERYPKPRNIDKLMFWIMAVTGCIPCTAEYIPDPNAPENCFRAEDYTVNRLQCRIDIPGDGTAEKEREEAAVRAYLFSNPNQEDIWMLENYKRNAITWLHRKGKRTTIG